MSLSKEKQVLDLIISERAMEVINHGLSGALAGCISTLILYPIENIKTRMQSLLHESKGNQETNEKEYLLTSSRREGSSNEDKKFKMNFIQAFKKVFNEEGISGFYKGTFLYVMGILGSFGAYFFWYEFFKGYFLKGGMNSLGYAKTATLAGIISAVVMNPVWVIHSKRLADPNNREKKISQIVEETYEADGVQGFYKGIGAGLILVLNPLIQFVIYENIKHKFEKSAKFKTLLFFIAGAFSKAVATFATYPYQTIKTNMHIHKERHITQIAMIKEIYEKRNIPGFFAGIGAKLSQTVLNSALMLMIYERLHRLIRKILIKMLKK